MKFQSAQLDHFRRVHAQMLRTASKHLEYVKRQSEGRKRAERLIQLNGKLFENESTASDAQDYTAFAKTKII